MILSRRPNDDDSRDGFTKWPFMTTHTWGEDPRGRWTLEVKAFDILSLSLNQSFEFFVESRPVSIHPMAPNKADGFVSGL